MQAVKEQERGRQRHGSGAAAAGPSAAFRDMFVSLVDPAGVLDMERCSAIASRMGEEARRTGYRAGERMASLLSDMFEDAAAFIGRPTSEGAMDYTFDVHSELVWVLRPAAEAYRKGNSPEPVAELEKTGATIARYRSGADKYRERLRSADPPGSGLEGLGRCYPGRICRDVVRAEQEEVRAMQRARGRDPIFPPPPRPIGELFGDADDPNISMADMISEMRGRGPPEGYRLVRIDDDDDDAK